jgi:hypothetical protein
MGVRASQGGAIEHPRQLDIGAVESSARYFVDTIVSDRPRADDFVGGFFCG